MQIEAAKVVADPGNLVVIGLVREGRHERGESSAALGRYQKWVGAGSAGERASR